MSDVHGSAAEVEEKGNNARGRGGERGVKGNEGGRTVDVRMSSVSRKG